MAKNLKNMLIAASVALCLPVMSESWGTEAPKSTSVKSLNDIYFETTAKTYLDLISTHRDESRVKNLSDANKYILEHATEILEFKKLNEYLNKRLPINDNTLKIEVSTMCGYAVIMEPGFTQLIPITESNAEKYKKLYNELKDKPAIEQLAYIYNQNRGTFNDVFHTLMRELGTKSDDEITRLYEPEKILDKLRPGWRKLAQARDTTDSASSSSSSEDTRKDKR